MRTNGNFDDGCPCGKCQYMAQFGRIDLADKDSFAVYWQSEIARSEVDAYKALKELVDEVLEQHGKKEAIKES